MIDSLTDLDMIGTNSSPMYNRVSEQQGLNSVIFPSWLDPGLLYYLPIVWGKRTWIHALFNGISMRWSTNRIVQERGGQTVPYCTVLCDSQEPLKKWKISTCTWLNSFDFKRFSPPLIIHNPVMWPFHQNICPPLALGFDHGF